MILSLSGQLEIQGGGQGRIFKCSQRLDQTQQLVCKQVWRREGLNYPLITKTPLTSFLPNFYGIHKTKTDSQYIVMEDLIDGFSSPCVADIKLGQRRFDLYTNPNQEKKRYMQVGSTSETLGVRIIDITKRRRGKVVMELHRDSGYRFTSQQFYNAMNEFLPGNLKYYFKEKIGGMIKAYENTMKDNPYMRLYGTSVLITYDGDSENNNENCLRVKLIDLAHSYMNITEAEHIDLNNETFNDHVHKGLQSLMQI